MQKLNRVILYCRSGFEKECVLEISDKAAELSIFGFAKVIEQSGYIQFECYQDGDAEKLISHLNFKTLIFARQMFIAGDLLTDLPIKDRITPILEALDGSSIKAGSLRVEVPDTNEGKELTNFCRKFTVPLRQKLRDKRLLLKVENPLKPVIHLLFINSHSCFIGYSYSNNNSPFHMGIPRLKSLRMHQVDLH